MRHEIIRVHRHINFRSIGHAVFSKGGRINNIQPEEEDSCPTRGNKRDE